jgi:hypothetical protein
MVASCGVAAKALTLSSKPATKDANNCTENFLNANMYESQL